MPSETIVTVAEVLGGFAVGWAIANVMNLGQHRHRWTPWGEPFQVNETDNGVSKTDAAYQSRRCETCGKYDQRRIGIMDPAWDDDNDPADPLTKVEPVAEEENT